MTAGSRRPECLHADAVSRGAVWTRPERGECSVADAIAGGARRPQRLARAAALLRREREQDVLGRDVLVLQLFRFVFRCVEDFQGPLREVAARYLDHVALDLPLEKQVHDTHELTVGTFLGKVTAGTWTLDVTIHRVRGLLRARPPSVARPLAASAIHCWLRLFQGVR